MIVAWLLFPLVVLVACLGCGLLVERLGGWALPGTILASVGLAAVIVIATFLTRYEATAPLATPAVVIAALVGYASSWSRVQALRLEWWALAPALGVFLVCAAPIVLSGNATFLGYYVLNDGVFHFSLITQLLSHAHDLTRLSPPSAYSSLLVSYLSTSYPIGADVAVGALRPLVGQDIAWVFQPFLAIIMSLGAAALYELLRTAVPSRPLRALTAFVAAQPALAYAYYLEASIKELATAWVITVIVVVVTTSLRRRPSPRGVLPLLVLAVAAVNILYLAVLPWLAAPVAVFVIATVWRTRGVLTRIPRRRLLLGGGAGVVVAGIAVVVLVQKASTFVSVATAVLTNPGDLGNLATPLPLWQIVGIWPSGDFRFPVINASSLTFVLIGVALTSGGLGAVWMIRRRHWAPLLLLAGNGFAAAYLLTRASPYASAKVMMIFSITALMVIMLGVQAIHDAGRRPEAWGLAVVIALGVLASNALAYRHASVAPRARLGALASIGARFDGRGPAFFDLSDEYAAYFLRREAPSDPAIGPSPVRPGTATPAGRAPWDPDIFTLSFAESFRLFVLGNGPLASRPPSNYRLTYRDRFYSVWSRTAQPSVVAHLPLSGPIFPAAIPRCTVVRRFAARAKRLRDELAYVARPDPAALIPAQAPRPPNWGLVGGDPASVIPREQDGAVSAHVSVPSTGRYDVDVTGDLSQQLRIVVDGRQVATIGDMLGPPGQVTRVTTISLTAGPHVVSVVRPAANLAPGDGNTNAILGPVMLIPAGETPAVAEIAPDQAGTLCGRTLDWIEIIHPGPHAA